MKGKIASFIFLFFAVLLVGCAPIPREVPITEESTTGDFFFFDTTGIINGSVVRLVDGDRVCYMVWGGNTIDMSCPLETKRVSENPDQVVLERLDGTEGRLNGGVARLVDGEYICHIVWGGMKIVISCE